MRLVRLAAMAAVLLTAVPAFAYKWQITDDSYIGVGALIQAQAQFTENAAPTGKDWSNDFFLRRARILVFGAFNKHVSFFLETDTPNCGKDGKWDAQLFVQDAFGTFRVIDEFQVDAGMILLPFTRHNMVGAIGLNAIDYHGSMIKFPAGSTQFWRDAGVQLRGYVFGQKLQYRLGVFAGSQNVAFKAKDPNDKEVEVGRSNPHDYPRFTGHVRYNVLGTETDFFPKGIYFATAPILSIGVGVDFAPDSVVTKAATFDAANAIATKAGLGHHLGIAGDVFADIPIGEDHEVVAQATFVYYDDGDRIASTGYGILAEAGYRWRFIEPVVGFDWFKSDATKADYTAIRGGVNGWILKHGASVKAEFAAVKDRTKKDDFVKQATVQAQIFF